MYTILFMPVTAIILCILSSFIEELIEFVICCIFLIVMYYISGLILTYLGVI